MVPFAGYEMPVQYPAGILKEHLHTREAAGLFDVSHMGQAAFLLRRRSRARWRRVTPPMSPGLKEGMQRYGLLLNDGGAIKDDFMVTRAGGRGALYLVVNAGTKEGDFAYIAGTLTACATLDARADRALLALQGPMAAAGAWNVIRPASQALTFMKVVRASSRRAAPSQPLRLYRRRRLRDFDRRRRCRARRARAAGRARSAADRSWRAR